MLKTISSLGIALKVRLMVVLTVALAVSLTALVLGWRDSYVQKRDFIHQSSLLADLVAQRSTAAVAFLSEKNAFENLGTLHVMGNIKYACLYNAPLNRVIAEHNFSNDHPYSCEPHVPEIIQMRENKELYIHKPMFQQTNRVGSLIMVLDSSRLQNRLLELLSTLVISAVASCAFALIATIEMQRGIYQPIVALSKIARDIAHGRKWTVRAEKTNEDELGELVDVFNEMVSIIERDQQDLESLAYYDPLTGLPNRRLFEERMENVLRNARENKSSFALLFIDLDDFKGINDSYGHDIGDNYLKGIAQRLRDVVRQGDMVARIGGDEFTIIAENIKSTEGAEKLCIKVMNFFKPGFELKGKMIPAKISVGIALGNSHTATIYDVLKEADIALYDAKNNGKNTYSVFTSNP